LRRFPRIPITQKLHDGLHQATKQQGQNQQKNETETPLKTGFSHHRPHNQHQQANKNHEENEASNQKTSSSATRDGHFLIDEIQFIFYIGNVTIVFAIVKGYDTINHGIFAVDGEMSFFRRSKSSRNPR
jgi:hypothetical protein